MDSVLNTVYYHQTSYTKPTKLVFPNLTRVDGYLYFHQTNNVIEVEMPILDSVGEYFYLSGNQSLRRVSVPQLQSIRKYIYVHSNTKLLDLGVCSLSHIYCDGQGQEPYISISGNNTTLDSIQPCFTATLHGTQISTDSVTTFSHNTAIATGVISSDCGVNDYSFCWSKSPNPTSNDFTTNATVSNNTFSGNLTGLDSNTTYYVRSYSSTGVYGNEVSFTTSP